jgi:signal peptidase II
MAKVKFVLMPDQRRHALGAGLWVALTVILLDQLSKLWVFNSFLPGQSVEVAPFFNLVLVFNPGAAFSFLADHAGWQRWFFSLIALLISGWIIWQLRQLAVLGWLGFGLALIMGGALGNLIDRLWLGMVIDFIDIHAAGWHWPAFNIADSAVCVGAVLYVLFQKQLPQKS